jgi:hypothetical protein
MIDEIKVFDLIFPKSVIEHKSYYFGNLYKDESPRVRNTEARPLTLLRHSSGPS